MAGMLLAKRYCVEYADGAVECFDDNGFWFSEKGMIIKWAILGALFGVFMLWFVGGYIHAKRRLRAGKPLLAYHRFLVTWQERKRYGQTAPNAPNHFTFYNSANPYQNRAPYTQRQDGSWAEPPPVYNGSDAPPGYGAAAGAGKANANQGGSGGGGMGMEMPSYGGGGVQQSGIIGGGGGGVEQAEQLPPRPPQRAKAVLKGFTDRFRK